jgi:hypothetical protein
MIGSRPVLRYLVPCVVAFAAELPGAPAVCAGRGLPWVAACASAFRAEDWLRRVHGETR